MGANERNEVKRICRDCEHWHRAPTNPNALNEIRGECRESPPAATAVVQMVGGGFKLLAWVAGYPPLAPETPACSHFAARKKIDADLEA
jgi:hypothetical protein